MKKTSPEKRIEMAKEFAFKYAQIDGDHHKMWVIDNILRILLGKKDYAIFVEEYYEEDEDGEVEYIWDTGVAP
jgi:uncharacterized HAD superfamily protein